MASEIIVGAGLSVYKPAVMASALGRAIQTASFTMTGNLLICGELSVATSATALPLGQVTQPHWAWFYNSDSSNFVKLRSGASGADLVRLYPREFALVPLEITAVPYAIADTAACLLEYLIAGL